MWELATNICMETGQVARAVNRLCPLCRNSVWIEISALAADASGLKQLLGPGTASSLLFFKCPALIEYVSKWANSSHFIRRQWKKCSDESQQGYRIAARVLLEPVRQIRPHYWRVEQQGRGARTVYSDYNSTTLRPCPMATVQNKRKLAKYTRPAILSVAAHAIRHIPINARLKHPSSWDLAG